MDDTVKKYGDIGTPERHRRKELCTILINGQPRTSVRYISPVVAYHNRKDLDIAERSAGEAIYRFYVTGWVGNTSFEVKERLDGGGKKPEITHKQVAAQRQYEAAKRLLDKEAFDLVHRVCVDEYYISDLYQHWYTRKKAKKLLRESLQKIAKLYGYL